jgi:5-(carboxyamino)imidazole ribonucleotide synthase
MSGATIGILGAGQLGRMLALAGYPLGLRVRVFDPTPDAPAGQLAPQTVAGYADLAALDAFAAGLDAITYEFENVPVAAARHLARHAPVYPPPQALEAAQDRLREKTFFRELGIPTPPFLAVDSRPALEAAVGALGLPAVLKTRRLGYDGKGQALLRAPADLDAAWEALGGQALILEGYVPFQRELSILGLRGRDGAIAFYPLVENTHREGILRRSVAPAPQQSQALQAEAEGFARRALAALDYVGLLAIELFEVDGRLLANEMAPRVHNSGHWTIEGAVCSQFENHLRSVLGLPLGSTAARGTSAMLNLIGSAPDPAALLGIEGAHLHLYGKMPRPGRKLGHVTLVAEDYVELERRLAALEAMIELRG